MPNVFPQSRRGLLVGAVAGLAAQGAISNASRAKNATNVVCTNAESKQGLSLASFGASGDGSDHTAAFSRARDALQSGSGGTLHVPPGAYQLSAVLNTRMVHLTGAGNAASNLRPAAAATPILRAADADASWHTLHIADLGFEGTASRRGTGLRLGNDRLTPHAEYTGRFLLERLRFENLEKAVERPFGNIGVDLTDCTFSEADFHVWSQGQPLSSAANDLMHAGALTLTRGSMQGAQRASIYVDGKNVVGSGQIVLDSVRFENNPGWVLYITNFNDRGPQPGILVRSCWNENNYSAASVQIGGTKTAPAFARLVDVPACTFEDTPIGPLVLENSHVITRGCNLDQLSSAIADARSTVTHYEARMFTGTAIGLVKSIGHLENTNARTSLNSPWFSMPAPVAPRAYDQAVLLSSNGQQPEKWLGTDQASSSVADVAMAWLAAAQELTVPGGATLISPLALAVPAGKWLVVQLVARLLTGPPPQVHVNGTAGLGGVCQIRERPWRTYTSVIQNNGTAIAGDNFYIYSGGQDAAVIRYGGYAVTQWDDAQEALAYANSLLFPRR